jgi:hypothetical protein
MVNAISTMSRKYDKIAGSLAQILDDTACGSVAFEANVLDFNSEIG